MYGIVIVYIDGSVSKFVAESMGYWLSIVALMSVEQIDLIGITVHHAITSDQLP